MTLDYIQSILLYKIILYNIIDIPLDAKIGTLNIDQ